MAGSDRRREPVTGGPAIILVRPQLGENIGTAARAMFNCGLTDLRLVAPRDGWPNARAVAAASGADLVLERARLYATAQEAVADLRHVYASTARDRYMLKPAATPRGAAAAMRGWIVAGEPCGVLFGPERAGLENDEVVLADTLLTVPLNPAHASLNLAQAVLLIGYEWFLAADATPAVALNLRRTRPATKDELEGFLLQLVDSLERANYFRPPEKKPSMVRSIRNIFQRQQLMEQDIRTLRGIVKELAEGPRKPGKRSRAARLDSPR
jgi:tRNA/rRNA methyltransferase